MFARTQETMVALIGNDDRNVFVDSFSGRAEESFLWVTMSEAGQLYLHFKHSCKGQCFNDNYGGLGSDIVDLPGLQIHLHEGNFTVLTWSNGEGSLQAR